MQTRVFEGKKVFDTLIVTWLSSRGGSVTVCRFEGTNREEYPKKEEAMARRRKIRFLVVFTLEDLFELGNADLPPAYLQHGAHQSPYHTPQKTVGDDPVYQAVILFFPAAVLDGAQESFYLGIPLGKSRKILMPEHPVGSHLQFAPVQGIRIEPGPVCQKGILHPVEVIPVFPADGVKPAMGVRGYGGGIA